jgi:hypothetical protein
VVEQPPVPYLNPDHSIPANQQGHRVFLDPSTGDAFVLFHPGDHDLIPVELNRHVEPAITADVDYDVSSETWRYTYTLANGPSARQPAVSWYFKDLTSGDCTITAPDGWYYLFPDILSNPPWPLLVIAARSIAQGIAPGKQTGNFILESKRVPGIQDVYVQGGTSRVFSLPAEPDDALAAELQRVLGFPYDYRKVQTIGPRLKIANDDFASAYRQEIQGCEAQGVCSHEFSTRATAFLKAGVQDKKGALDALNSAAKSEIEKGLARALRILSAKA